MHSGVGQAIRDARRGAGLTQEQLGRRLGLKGRAISRWERDDNVPTKRNLQALVTAVKAVDQEAAAKLAIAVAGGAPSPQQTSAPTPAPGVSSSDGQVALELAILGMADELDLPPRRVRGALVRLLKRLRGASFSLETTQRALEQWLADGC